MAYIAASDYHSYGNIPGTDNVDDAELALLIARATTIIDQYTGRHFETDSTATCEYTRYYSAADVDGQILYLDKDLADFATASAIVAGAQAITSSNFVTLPSVDKPYYAIQLKANCPYAWDDATSDGDYENNIAIGGQWGYSTAAPNDIKHAALRLVRWLYQQARVNPQEDRPIVLQSGTTVMPARIPSDITAILDSYRKVNIRG